MKNWFAGTFRSLRLYNYRLWAAGSLVSNVGTWMQRIAQDWLVLTELTHHSASAVGITMGLQFAPPILFLPWTGLAADYFDQRKLMLTTQALMGLLALALGLLTVTGVVQLWHVYVFAFLFGTVAAFDAPVRQTYVSELVGEADLANAVALNSMTFNGARMLGPAAAGVLIAGVGTGWAFLLNGASFIAVLLSILFLRRSELRPSARAQRGRSSFVDGFRYVWHRPDLRANLLMLLIIGMFGMNFAIFIATMAVKVFHADANGFGLLTSLMAVGTIIGGLMAAARERPYFKHLVAGAGVFGVGCTLGALAPSFWLYGAALVLTGMASLTFLNSTNALLQLSTEPAMRGRVMAIRMAIAMGGTPIGAPIVGWVADHAGPRWAMAVGAAAGFGALLVGIVYLMKIAPPDRAASGGHQAAREAVEPGEELT
ncbi:MFS transporter [Sphingobium nicotianae]|uniref:MFS transporter n=1 Tax=Sphingobium nicotianae TaxID=2782607 RepID=A0A9X1DA27_9SPHN|nr:MFS transporter [Sphingobium nicotianae]MBT2186169.1 MFS transporter [Sphingobium nicotianae]